MPDAGFIAALLAGLTGSLHCVAMCGGFAVTAGARRVHALRPARALRMERAATQLGRLATYASIGAAFGAAGGAAFAIDWPPVQRWLYVAANVVLIATGLRLALSPRPRASLEVAGLALFRRTAQWVAPVLENGRWTSRLALGALWGLTPCALIYALLPVALLSGSALRGAGVMLGLWLGTLPALLLATSLAGRLGTPTSRRVAAGVVATLGVAGIYRALMPGALAVAPFCFGS